MDGIFTFLINFFVSEQETFILNIPMLLFVVAVLLVALGICVSISRKNRLYLAPKKKDKVFQISKENEAA